MNVANRNRPNPQGRNRRRQQDQLAAVLQVLRQEPRQGRIENRPLRRRLRRQGQPRPQRQQRPQGVGVSCRR